MYDDGVIFRFHYTEDVKTAGGSEFFVEEFDGDGDEADVQGGGGDDDVMDGDPRGTDYYVG